MTFRSQSPSSFSSPHIPLVPNPTSPYSISTPFILVVCPLPRKQSRFHHFQCSLNLSPLNRFEPSPFCKPTRINIHTTPSALLLNNYPVSSPLLNTFPTTHPTPLRNMPKFSKSLPTFVPNSLPHPTPSQTMINVNTFGNSFTSTSSATQSTSATWLRSA
jgi:hypothetical protein